MLITSPERLRADDPELLIEEARQHRRRRHLRLAAVLVAALGVGAGLWALLGNNAAATSAAGGTSGAAVSTRCPGTDLGLLAFVHAGALSIVDFEHCSPTTLVRKGAAGTPAFSHDGSYVSFGHGTWQRPAATSTGCRAQPCGRRSQTCSRSQRGVAASS
jgi:hypothetical protein